MKSKCIQYVREHYADMTVSQLKSETGLSASGITEIAKRYNLEKSEEFIKNFGYKVFGGRNVTWEKDVQKRKGISATRKIICQQERRRVLFGLPQKTNIKVVRAPRGKYEFRSSLRKHGYIVGRGSDTAAFNETTKRSRTMERRASKYGITIKQQLNTHNNENRTDSSED